MALTGLAFAGLATATARAASWGQPFRLASPATLDVIPADIAFSPTGVAAVGYGIQDEDNPGDSTAFEAERSVRGRIGRPLKVGGQQQILDLAYAGPNLELLAGTSAHGLPCCGSAGVLQASTHGGFGGPQTLVTGLSGTTAGRLVVLPGALLAAVATARGVWMAQSSGSGRIGSARRLTASGAFVEALDATSLPDAQSAVAWAAGSGQSGGARTIYISRGSPKQAPRGARPAITVAAGRQIDELALARSPSAPTVAWIESWFDATGGYRSEVAVTDIRHALAPRLLSAPGELASGLSFAADARGDQALVWKACTTAGTCALRAVLRAAHGRFGAVQDLPAADASQSPAVTVSPTGQALVAWIAQGHVLAAAAGPRAAAFGPAHVVSATNYAADVSLAFGPAGKALAVWTQGTLNQSVIGAVFSAH